VVAIKPWLTFTENTDEFVRDFAQRGSSLSKSHGTTDSEAGGFRQSALPPRKGVSRDMAAAR
jgi:hypothetical protein